MLNLPVHSVLRLFADRKKGELCGRESIGTMRLKLCILGSGSPMQRETLGWIPSEALLGNPSAFRKGVGRERRLPGTLVSDLTMQELYQRRSASVCVLGRNEGSQECSCQVSRFSQACPACSL